MPSQEFAPDSYWNSVKQRLQELRQMPGDAIDRMKQKMGEATTIMNPNLRPGVPQEALPGNMQPQGQMDPLERQRVIDALTGGGAGGMDPRGMPQGVDQGQLLLQEAARRGIPVPPDSPLLSGGGMGGQMTPDNPAGIQF